MKIQILKVAKMISLLRAIALIAALSIPSYAMSATTVLVLPVTTSWTDLGAGPFLNVSANPLDLFQISDTTPGTASFGFHLTPEFPWSSATSSHLWVMGNGPVVVSK